MIRAKVAVLGLPAMLVVAALAGGGCTPTSSALAPPAGAVAPEAASPSGSPCLGTPPQTGQRKVVWIWLENHSRSQTIGPVGSVANSKMPGLNAIARTCGEATNARALTHPSLPNYLGAVTGVRSGISATCSVTACPQTSPTLFDQLNAAGRTWGVFAQSMPGNCIPTNFGGYAARHNPPVYFPRLRASCRTHDLPLGTPTSGRLASLLAAGKLPQFTMIVPDLCSSSHDCSRSVSDTWLRSWLTPLLDSRDYRSGRTTIVITYDEGAGGRGGQDCRTQLDDSCRIATVVAAPSVRPGTKVATAFDHMSLLATTEQLLGLGLLGEARTAPRLTTAFHLK